MSNILKLSNPLYVNGQQLNELTYTLNLEVNNVLTAMENRAKAHNNVDTVMKAVEFDTELHGYIGMQCIIKVNPQIDINDLRRLSGIDAILLFKVGRDFFMQTKLVGKSEEKPSEEQSATIQEDTTVQN